jgi:hypothetical protein
MLLWLHFGGRGLRNALKSYQTASQKASTSGVQQLAVQQSNAAQAASLPSQRNAQPRQATAQMQCKRHPHLLATSERHP